MITGELKSKVDRIWDTMWSGGISNPLSVIEQLTYLLFIKRLDELQIRRNAKPVVPASPLNLQFSAKSKRTCAGRHSKTPPPTRCLPLCATAYSPSSRRWVQAMMPRAPSTHSLETATPLVLPGLSKACSVWNELRPKQHLQNFSTIEV